MPIYGHLIVTMACPVDTLPYVDTVTACVQHKDRPLVIYCYTCEDALCLSCFFQGHKHHDCALLEDAAAIMRDQLAVIVREGTEELARLGGSSMSSARRQNCVSQPGVLGPLGVRRELPWGPRDGRGNFSFKLPGKIKQN